MSGNSQSRSHWYIIAASSIVLVPRSIHAQSNIVPDNTLGNESSEVTPDLNNALIEQITGGAQRGQNLFHSFEEFNVKDGSAVYFSSPNADIANILSRVTGNDVSEIFGTLGTSGASQPDLFLINPNGIIFGENASLDVGSSFVATTADSVQFGKEGFFNASNPETPPLLTVQPSAFLFNQVNPGTIQNNSTADAGSDPTGTLNFFGLRVPDGENFSLFAGDIEIDAGGIVALDGRIDLGAVKTGSIELDEANNFSFSNNSVRGNMTLANQAGLLSSGSNGGKIAIAAENINVSDNSTVITGILNNLGSTEAQADDIELDATGNIAIYNSFIYNRINNDAVGSGGNLAIDTTDLVVANGGQIGAFTFGTGDTGEVNINANGSVSLTGGNSESLTGIFARTTESGSGNVGNLNISAESISLTEGALLDARTFGRGNAGNIAIATSNSVMLDISSIFTTATNDSIGNAGSIDLDVGSLTVINGGSISSSSFGEGNAGRLNIDAKESIGLSGISGDGQSRGGIFVQIAGEGQAENITLDTKKLTIQDGAIITAGVNETGTGRGGDLTVNASESVELTGVSADSQFRSAISVETGGEGQAGNITLGTKELVIQDGAIVTAGVRETGTGRGGNLTINASESIKLTGVSTDGQSRSAISVETGGAGQAGDLTLNTPRLAIQNSAIISANTRQGSTGRGGNLFVDTKNLTIDDGGQISASTFGISSAGNLTINASESVELTGVSADSQFRSAISVETGGEGQAGNITLGTKELVIQDGAIVTAGVRETGTGRGGNLTINASESIKLTGVSTDGQSRSAISVETGGAGQAGDLALNTPRLAIQDGAIVSANTRQGSTGRGGNLFVDASEFVLLENSGLLQSRSRGSGVAGNLTVITDNLTLNGNSLISTDTSNADGGNINLSVFDLITLNNNSNISATAGTAETGGDGGNIGIDTEFIVAFPNGSNDITANAFEGTGGNIEIAAESLFGIESRLATPPNETNDVDASSQFGLDGEISIETPDVDPARGLDNLPDNVVDASRLITRNCLNREAQQPNEFIVTGRGGLPLNPEGTLSSEATLSAEWVNLPETATKSDRNLGDSQQVVSDSQEVVEAQGWRVKPDGTVVLVASRNDAATDDVWLDGYSCDRN